MAQQRPHDTKERILDAAEALFADRGFSATSMRNITSQAGVNLAAANYHFGSKDLLIQAVFARRLLPINLERIERLDQLESAANAAGPTAAQIVEAFIGPPLRMGRDAKRGGPVFWRLLGHAMNQPKDQIRTLLAGQFREVLHRFIAAVKRVRPDLPEREIPWRLLFIAGAMAHTMVMADEVNRLYGASDRTSDAEQMIARLVPFLAAGLNSPLPAAVACDPT